jgi:hypothetical protein
MGLSWKDVGDNTVRFYAETAHDGVTDPQDASLMIGPWATRIYYEFAGIINGTTFEELGIDDMAYWSLDDPSTTLTPSNYDAHSSGPGTYGNFFYVDVPNFVSGEYLLTVESPKTAIGRPAAYSYLTARISVPEPSVFMLLATGLLLLFFPRLVGRGLNTSPATR